MFAELSHHRWFRRCFSKMRCILACDVALVDSESDFAGRDESDRRLRIAGNIEAVGSMRVSSHVEGFHPGELVPLLLVVLVATDMFPCESERKSALNLDDLVDHIVFGAERGACERRGCREV